MKITKTFPYLAALLILITAAAIVLVKYASSKPDQTDTTSDQTQSADQPTQSADPAQTMLTIPDDIGFTNLDPLADTLDMENDLENENIDFSIELDDE